MGDAMMKRIRTLNQGDLMIVMGRRLNPYTKNECKPEVGGRAGA